MSSTSKIVLDGDSTGYVGAQNRAQAATRKTAREAATIGTEFSKSTVNLAKMITALGTLASTARGYATAMREAQSASADASKNLEGIAADLELAARAPLRGPGGAPMDQGMDPNQSAAVRSMLDFPGTRSRDEMAAFLTQVVGTRQGRMPGVAGRMRAAFASGVFGQEELMAGLPFGQIPDAGAIDARRGSLTPESQRELRTRELESMAATLAKRFSAAGDDTGRRMQALIGVMDAIQQQSGTAQALRSVPGFGAAFDFGSDMRKEYEAGRMVPAADTQALAQQLMAAFSALAGETRQPTVVDPRAAGSTPGNPLPPPPRMTTPREFLPAPGRSRAWFLGDDRPMWTPAQIAEAEAKSAAANRAMLDAIQNQTSVIQSATAGIPTLRDDKR